MNEPTRKDRTEVLTWLGYVVASPLAVLGLTMFLLSACAPVDLCPDRQCEYGYAEAAGEKGEDNDGQGEDAEKGEAGTGKGHGGKDKGDKGDDD